MLNNIKKPEPLAAQTAAEQKTAPKAEKVVEAPKSAEPQMEGKPVSAAKAEKAAAAAKAKAEKAAAAAAAKAEKAAAAAKAKAEKAAAAAKAKAEKAPGRKRAAGGRKAAAPEVKLYVQYQGKQLSQEEAVEAVKATTRKDYYIVEEFLEGEEFGAQAFVYDGKLQFVLPHGDYVFMGDTGVPVGHFAPYELSPQAAADVYDQTERAIRAMKLDNCAINADFIMKDGKTYVLEIGGRSGATCLAELVSIYYGYDYYEKIIQAALGESPRFPQDQAVPNASRLLMSDRDGVIRSIANHNGPDENIYEIMFDYTVGDPVKKFHVGPNRIGHVITRGTTLQEATDALQRAMDRIEIIVE